MEKRSLQRLPSMIMLHSKTFHNNRLDLSKKPQMAALSETILVPQLAKNMDHSKTAMHLTSLNTPFSTASRTTLPSLRLLRQYDGRWMTTAIQEARMSSLSYNPSPLSMAVILEQMAKKQTENILQTFANGKQAPSQPHQEPLYFPTMRTQARQHCQPSTTTWSRAAGSPQNGDHRSEYYTGNHRPMTTPHRTTVQDNVDGKTTAGNRKSRKLCKTNYCNSTAVSGRLCRRHGGKKIYFKKS